MNRFTLLALPLPLSLALLCHAPLSAADWNQWRGASRDGVAPDAPTLLEQLPADGLRPVWKADERIPAARSGGWSSPVVADGRVYLFTHKRTKVGQDELPPPRFPYLPPEKRVGMTDKEYEEYEKNRRDEQERRAKNFRFDEVIYCLDAKTGELIWENEQRSYYTRFSQSGTPAAVGGKLFILGAGRVARCLDTANGKQLWETRLPGEFRDEFLQSSFAVAGETAAVLCGQLFGLDTATGEIRWTVGDDSQSALHSSPVVWRHDGQDYFIANLDGQHTACVQADTGEEVWRVESQAGHSTPVIHGDRLLTYGSSRKRGLRCFRLSLEQPELLWTYQGLSDPGSSPVVVGDHVYVQGDRRLSCVDLRSGDARWSIMLDLDRPRYTSLVAADGKVIYAFDGVFGFHASADECRTWMQGKIDKDGLLGEEAMFRQQLKMDELEETAEGQKEAQRLWRNTVGNSGPLACASPALADGRLYVRLRDGLACYDLRAK